MKIAVVLLTAFVAFQSTFGEVDDKCMTCICTVENNCREGACNDDVGSDSCGPYQIKEAYYTDARTVNSNLGRDWRSCTKFMACSNSTVQAYMSRYATRRRLRVQPTCEHFSRIHNGGPNGYRKSSTVNYWKKVKKCLRQVFRIY